MTERPVVVLGMHRSGTSVLTGALHELGLPLCAVPDLYQAADNPHGHFESRTVIAANDWLLARHGGTWSRPPLVGPDALSPPDMRVLERLRHVFDLTHPASGWLLKDPRLCLTLPAWRHAWASEPVVVMSLRAPGLVARSLQRRDGFSWERSVALWEWYVAGQFTSVAGLQDVLAVHHADMVTDPYECLRTLANELSERDVQLDTTRLREAATTVRPVDARTESIADGPMTRLADLWGDLSVVRGSIDPSRSAFTVSDETQKELARLLGPAPVRWARRMRHRRPPASPA